MVVWDSTIVLLLPVLCFTGLESSMQVAETNFLQYDTSSPLQINPMPRVLSNRFQSSYHRIHCIHV